MHESFEGPGIILNWARRNNITVSYTRVFLQEPLPEQNSFDGLVIMGGGMNIYEEKKYPWLPGEKAFIQSTLREKKPMLGICLGSQLIADTLGERVFKNESPEIGWFPVTLEEQAMKHPWFKGLPDYFTAFHWHGDTFKVPENAVPLALSKATSCQGFIYDNHVLALQFHPETDENLIEDMVKNGKDELVADTWVQDSEEISENTWLANTVAQWFLVVLDRLFSEKT
jgi:GMP synthase-like glutamine amidotransferase